LGVANGRDGDARQCRSAGGDKSQWSQQEFTLIHSEVRVSQPPGDHEGDGKESDDLMAFDPIYEMVHDIFPSSDISFILSAR
jgi:hypothetical protein